MKKIVYLPIISIILMACQLSLPFGLGELFKKAQTFIYAEVDRDNQPTGDLIISDFEGNEIKSFSLPEIDGLQDIFFYPVRASGIALISRYSDEEGREYFWLDVNNEELQKLRLDKGLSPLLNPLNPSYQSGWEHFGVFTNFSLDDPKVFLFDLDTGKLEDLSGFIKGELPIFYKFSSDETYMMVYGFSNPLLLSTEGPEITREYGGKNNIDDIHFSPDNKMIVYLSLTEDEYHVVIENLSNQEREILIRSAYYVRVLGFIDNDSIIISKEEKSFMININSGEEELILNHAGDSAMIQRSPSGDNVFLNIGGWSEQYYYWIDLRSMEAEELIDLEYMKIKANGESCVYLEESYSPIKIKSVNMDTGQITDMEFDLSTPNYVIRPYLSNDAESTLLISTDQFDGLAIYEGYAFNCITGDVFDLGSGRITLGGVSSDNDYAIYGFQSEGDDFSEIILLNLESGEMAELGRGLSPTWIMP